MDEYTFYNTQNKFNLYTDKFPPNKFKKKRKTLEENKYTNIKVNSKHTVI